MLKQIEIIGKANVNMGYKKWVEFSEITLKTWSSPDGNKNRVYITAESKSGTRSQRGIATLGYVDEIGAHWMAEFMEYDEVVGKLSYAATELYAEVFAA